MTDVVIAPCDVAAARYAVEHWHYSGTLPTGKLVKFGVWEAGRFVGVVIYSRGASPHLGKAYGLDHVELCELTRIAMTDHATPVSQVVAETLRQLKATNPGLRLVVSFADPQQGHLGGIYQAGNWIYTGQSGAVDEYFVNGRWRHKKGVWYGLRASGRQGRNLPVVEGGVPVPFRTAPGKHRYLMPLDRGMRRLVAPMALPFPRGSGLHGEPTAPQAGGPGSTPGDRSTPAGA